VYRGTLILLLSIPVAIVCHVLLILAIPEDVIEHAETGFDGTIAAISLWGVLCLTTREPRNIESAALFPLGGLLRISALVFFLVSISGFLRLDEDIESLVDLSALLIKCALYFGICIFFRRLAVRIPNVKLAKATTIVMWSYTALMVLFVVIVGIEIGRQLNSSSITPSNLALVAIMAITALAFVLSICAIICLIKYCRALKQAVVQAKRSIVSPEPLVAPNGVIPPRPPAC
jgi:hypothetical protein